MFLFLQLKPLGEQTAERFYLYERILDSVCIFAKITQICLQKELHRILILFAIVLNLKALLSSKVCASEKVD
ncbi:hypothetical protein BpHYR1_044336 [Brachionus plicatilis]|uniref:Uncharacterized protein n=1 Tax=Brachionus plicatilis TaxID=10195 RepID=A0A3M7RSL8_BRAPC|nr:hypothetical protein BpHYR1_044336 [Brachionus plicatilis]